MTLERRESNARWLQYGLPTDLSEWAAKALLIKLCLNAVQAVPNERLEPAAPKRDALALLPRMMLTLLTYCYATGLYGSRQIEQQIANDPTLNYLTAHKVPCANALRRFRNRHREIITGCLGNVCCAVGRIKFATQNGGNALNGRDGISFDWFERLMQLQCLCDARERIAQADLTDQESSAEFSLE